MMTPIAKIKLSKSNHLVFYNDYEYQKKLESLGDEAERYDIKYFKGLGTSNDEEIKESFAEKVVRFELTANFFYLNL